MPRVVAEQFVEGRTVGVTLGDGRRTGLLVGSQQLGMRARDVPTLDERVETCLPVAIDDDRLVPGEPHVLELVALHPRRQWAEVVEQWLGVGIHVDEHPASPRVDLHLGEAELAGGTWIEILLIGQILERTVEVPAPGVERASELTDPPPPLDEPGPPVPTGVVVGPQALLGPDHHDRLTADLKIHVVPDPLDLVETTGVQPGLREQALDLEAEELRVRITPLGHEGRSESPTLGHVEIQSSPSLFRRCHERTSMLVPTDWAEAVGYAAAPRPHVLSLACTISQSRASGT